MKTSTILAASVLMTTGCVADNYQTDTFKTKGGKEVMKAMERYIENVDAGDENAKPLKVVIKK